jgi:predicted secreted protein
MSKINGTLLLLYADGVVIAAQKGCTINVEQDLPDASNKESAGWEEHINGLRNASVDFDALFSTTGISAGELMDYIIDRQSLLLGIVGGVTFPMVAEVDMKSVKIDAPQEQAMSISGSLKVKGALYHLKGTEAALVTDPDSGGTDYDTLTQSGLGISSAINLAGSAYCKSNSFSITTGDVIKVAVFLTSNSGQVPSMTIYEVGGGAGAISDTQPLVAGLNIITLTVTDTHTGCLNITNSAAANWALSPIYLFKYVET